MVNIELSKRYARSIYDIAKTEDKVKKVYTLLNLVMELYMENDEFKNIILNPVVKKKEKKEILMKLLDKEYKEDELDILFYLIDKSRMSDIRAITKEYLKIFYLENNEQEVIATFSKELSDVQKEKLKINLEKKLKKKIILDVKVDESLIGGGIIKINDTVIDSSVKSQIKEIKNIF